MSEDRTKHLSFLFVVPLKYFSSSVVVKTPYEINVRYTLDQFGKVLLDDFNIKPGMAQYIIKWNELEEEMRLAAENNSKQYRRPGQGGGFKMRPEGLDLYEDIHDQWKQEVMR